MSECETPLLDLLRSVPADARLIYEHSPTHSQSIPVGTLAARCVAEWAALSQGNDKAEREIERLTDDYVAATHLLADRDAQIERLTALNSALTDKSNSYLIENARLDRELAAANAVIDKLIAALQYHQEQTRPIHSTQIALDAARTLRKGAQNV